MVAIEERLVAASPELREARDRLHGATSVILVLALGYIGLGIVFYLATGSVDYIPSGEAAAARADLIASCVVGTAFLVLFVATRRFPVASMMVALFLWLALQLAHYGAAPQRLLLHFLGLGGVGVLFIKIVVLVLLLRGAQSALRARAVRRRVVGGSLGAVVRA